MTEFKRDTYDFGDGKLITTRSGWEMNYCFYLEWLKKQGEIKDWEYEPQRYYFIDYKVKPPKPLGNGYLPDFKVTNNDGSWYLVEIKGRMQRQNKLKRMKRFYPEIKLELVDSNAYNELKRKVGKICNFE